MQYKRYKRLQKQVLNLPPEIYNDIIDQETFIQLNYHNIQPNYSICALHITGHESNANIFSSEVFQQYPYDTRGLPITNYVEELNIHIFLDNGCMFPIIQKNIYDRHKILQRCLNLATNNDCTHRKWRHKVSFNILHSTGCHTATAFGF